MRAPAAAQAVRAEHYGLYRVLLVGEAPARDPLKNHLECRLLAKAMPTMLDLPGWALNLARRTLHANLLRRWPGKDGKGSQFPDQRARREARAVITGLRACGAFPTVLLCGRRVGRAFGLGSPDYFTWFEDGGRHFAVVPHPSGVNLWWNDPGHRRLALDFFHVLAQEVTA